MKLHHALAVSVLLAAVVCLTPGAGAHYCVNVANVVTLSGPCGFPCPYDWQYHHHTAVFADGSVASCESSPGCWECYCLDQPVHWYAMGTGAGGNFTTHGVEFVGGAVLVMDTNTGDCGTDPARRDGDYDWGVGGGFFGYGDWARDPDCNYLLNVHGPNVVVNDVVFGSAIAFVTAENDRDGPTKIWNPVTETYVCETDGSIRPGDPAENPTADPDDCVSEVFVGVGATCGEGGGDGGYWVVLMGTFVDEADGGVALSNPPTTGTITAF